MQWPVAVTLFLLQVLAAEAVSDVPAASGVYCRQDGARWVRLQPAPVAEMKMRGMDLFVTTGGFTSLGMDIVCRGTRAAVRLNAVRPVFFVRGTGSSKDAMLIRMMQKKDSRTFQTSSADVSVENKSGFKKGDIRKLAVTEYADDSYALSSEEDLDPGEYLLVFGTAANSFDFGIDRVK